MAPRRTVHIALIWLASTGEVFGLVTHQLPMATAAGKVRQWCAEQVGAVVLGNVVVDTAVWMHSCFMLMEQHTPNDRVRLVQVWTIRCETWPHVPAGYYSHMAYVYGGWLTDAVLAAFGDRLWELYPMRPTDGVVVGLKRHGGRWYNAGYSDYMPGYDNRWRWPMEPRVRKLWAPGHPITNGSEMHAVFRYDMGKLTAVSAATYGVALCQIQHATHERAATSGHQQSHFRRDKSLGARPTPEATYKEIVGERSPLLCANRCARAPMAQCTAAAYSVSRSTCLLAWDMHNATRYVVDDSYDVYWKLTIE